MKNWWLKLTAMVITPTEAGLNFRCHIRIALAWYYRSEKTSLIPSRTMIDPAIFWTIPPAFL